MNTYRTVGKGKGHIYAGGVCCDGALVPTRIVLEDREGEYRTISRAQCTFDHRTGAPKECPTAVSKVSCIPYHRVFMIMRQYQKMLLLLLREM